MRLLAAELLKVWTAPRTLFGILLAEVAFVLLGVIGALHDAANDVRLPETLERDLVNFPGGIAMLFSALFGILIATTEYRHGTITVAFLAAPVRERVIAAKTGAALVVSASFVLVALLLSLGIAQIWVGGRADYHFGSYEYRLIGRVFLDAAIVAVIGVFIGASLKRQLAGVILVLGWLFFIEQALAGLFPGTIDYLVGASIFAIVGDGSGDLPSFAHGLAVIAIYAVGLAVVAVALTRRRDIT
jgi:ABC-type transport system involved in multi-copper enzyme maturation permease subunit